MSRFDNAFAGLDRQTYTLAATTTAQTITITGTGLKAPSMRINNAGPGVAYMRLSNSTNPLVATTADVRIPINLLEVQGKGLAYDTISIVSASTSDISISLGEGV